MQIITNSLKATNACFCRLCSLFADSPGDFLVSSSLLSTPARGQTHGQIVVGLSVVERERKGNETNAN